MESKERNVAIKVENLSIGYTSKYGGSIIAKDIHFSLDNSELAAIVGVNGIGKSTLLRTLGNVQSKLSGGIEINGKALETFKPLKLASEISMVLTEPIASRNMSVQELVALGRQPYTNWIGTLSAEDKSKIAAALKMLELDDMKLRKCHELSDGQLQRVMIARALAQDTSIILLDEPTTHLDLYHKIQILKLLRQISHQTAKTILFTTHEIEAAIQLCDKVLILDGGLNAFNSPAELIRQKHFENIFPSDTITFNPQSGSFRIEK